MTALFVLRSPPRSGVFIAVDVGCCWTPLSSLSEVLPLPAAEFFFQQIKLVVNLSLGRIVGYLELGPLPSYLFSLGVFG